MQDTTIAAIATPPGSGGIGIIRMSGPDAERILNEIFVPAGKGKLPLKNRYLTYGELRSDTEILDECLAVIMRGPYSYTREDVAELQLHGGTQVLQRVLELCLSRGARLAEPGEFTRRAFLNGRIDLSRAEAVMNLISARGEQAYQAAIRQMQGGTADFVRQASDALYKLQAGLAACIDYPEEISDEEGVSTLQSGLESLIRELEEAADERNARLISDGIHITLYGTPNAGKSSLLNALLGQERAIVTSIPGTTRDTVEGEILLDGIRVYLTDTAGLRDTEDPIEKIGVARSEQALNTADIAMLVVDGSQQLNDEEEKWIRQETERCIVLINKSDLPVVVKEEDIHRINPVLSCLTLSAISPESTRPLKQLIREKIRLADRMTLSQPRHVMAVRKALGFLHSALETLKIWTPDMAATDLQAAQAALGEITGDQADEKLLDEVFSSFCVGK